MNWKPKFIQLPIDKMAGAPWNLLDYRGFRIALCGTDGNHEKDGEVIANDLLNLVAIGEASGELLEKAAKKMEQKDAELKAALDRVEELERERRGLLNEVDCRIEHGAESGGHLEYVRERLRRQEEAENV